jgi:hypothetical protein
LEAPNRIDEALELAMVCFEPVSGILSANDLRGKPDFLPVLVL